MTESESLLPSSRLPSALSQRSVRVSASQTLGAPVPPVLIRAPRHRPWPHCNAPPPPPSLPHAPPRTARGWIPIGGLAVAGPGPGPCGGGGLRPGRAASHPARAARQAGTEAPVRMGGRSRAAGNGPGRARVRPGPGPGPGQSAWRERTRRSQLARQRSSSRRSARSDRNAPSTCVPKWARYCRRRRRRRRRVGEQGRGGAGEGEREGERKGGEGEGEDKNSEREGGEEREEGWKSKREGDKS